MLARHRTIVEGQLSRELALDRPALARDLALLARRGLIAADRISDRANRRWRLTPAGHDEIARLRPCWKRVQTRLMQAIGKKDWKTLLSILDRVAQLSG
jgi:DNA-binding MarR family transcriptional regulator